MSFNFSTHPFTGKLQNVKQTGKNQWSASCPCGQNHANDDKTPSLFVGYDPVSEKIGIYCHKGCDKNEILSAVGCDWQDLFTGNMLKKEIEYFANRDDGIKAGLKFVDAYNYSYPPYNDGLHKIRYVDKNGNKTFRWIRLGDNGKCYTSGRKGLPNRLFVSGSLSDNTVILVEGEKDAITVHNLTGQTAVSAENGATTGKAQDKWTKEYNAQLAGKTVFILYDNDEAGKKFADIEASQLFGKAKEVWIMDLCSVWPECPKKGDITDLFTTFGTEKAKELFYKLLETAVNYTAESVPVQMDTVKGFTVQTGKDIRPNNKNIEKESASAGDPSLPEWVTESTYNGRTTIKLNEPLFCQMFRDENKVARINNVFYYNGKQVTDAVVKAGIQNKLVPYFTDKTGRKTSDVFITLQNYCLVEQPEPDEHKIFCRDNTTITIDDNGELSIVNEDVFTLTRISAKYEPEAECPLFIKYLNDLFYEEDIPALQEFMGYCLIPCTKAQAGLFIHGKGGEGKSVLTDVMLEMFGHAAIQEKVERLGDRFILANLENRLVCVDGEMTTKKLYDTSVMKQVITNNVNKPLQVERKNEQKFDAFIYARIFAIGNDFIGSCLDHSNGFYRRQLLIDCKPKTRPEEQDDRFMSNKVCREINGIFNFALSGLQRLVKNGFQFSVSERMKAILNDVKQDGDNTLSFFDDDSVIIVGADRGDCITSFELYSAYILWCQDNAESPVNGRTFLRRIGDRYRLNKQLIQTETKRVRGYVNMRLTRTMQKRVEQLDPKTTDRINRMML